MSLRRRLAISVSTLMTVATLLYLMVIVTTSRDGIHLTADFGRAGQGLTNSSTVKMRGVTVGTVARIDLRPDNRARVTLRIDRGVRVPDSVTAAVEPASAFGPKFVNLIPGDREATGPYLADGRQITSTSDPKDLGDLLAEANKTVAAVDPDEVATIVHTLAQGLDGTGPQLRRLIDNTDTITGVAYRHRGDAQRFLSDTAKLSDALRGTGADIVGITGDVNALTPLLAGGKDRIGPMADGAAQLLGRLSRGLDAYGGGLGALFNSGERATAVIYAQLGLAGDGVRNLNWLPGLYTRIVETPGPGGKHVVKGQAFLPSNPCELLVGLCGPAGRGPRR